MCWASWQPTNTKWWIVLTIVCKPVQTAFDITQRFLLEQRWCRLSVMPVCWSISLERVLMTLVLLVEISLFCQFFQLRNFFELNASSNLKPARFSAKTFYAMPRVKNNLKNYFVLYLMRLLRLDWFKLLNKTGYLIWNSKKLELV